jgi:hypothetical protein
LIAHISGNDRDPAETDRLQLNPRMVRMPHSDAHSHSLGGEAVPTEEAHSAEHHNHVIIYSGTGGPDNASRLVAEARIS